MKFAVNYSLPTIELIRQKQIEIDLLKCPAWRDLINHAQQIHPAYVHFPLMVGLGIDDAYDHETKRAVDWNLIEALLQTTATPFVNLHLATFARDYPNIPLDTTDPAHTEFLIGQILRDVRPVVARFGAARVIIENDNDAASRVLRPALLPHVIRFIVEETGCGFLFDLAHARMAADYLGMDPHAYIAALPMARAREMHVTGLQRFEGHWLEAARRDDAAFAQLYAGRWMDHLPMTDPDWDFFAWALQQIRAGAWATPEIIAFEYGGVGKVWQAVTDADMLATQIPRMAKMIRNGNEFHSK
jgi:uncharacterized protein (UPF0276 family)